MILAVQQTPEQQVLTLINKKQLNKIILNLNGTPDYLAINIYYDTLRSWYNPKIGYKKDGNIYRINKLNTPGIFLNYKKLSEEHGCSKETIRTKLVKLESLGLVQRSFQHRETSTTKSYNKLIVYVWKETPHFYNNLGIDSDQVSKLIPQTNANYIEEKFNVVFASKTKQTKALRIGGGIQTSLGTKELNNISLNKDIDLEANFSEISSMQIQTPASDLQSKKIVAKRKKPTNSQKKARVYRPKFLQYEPTKTLTEMPPITAIECSNIQLKSGRDFDINAQNEMLKDMAKRLHRLFCSREQFLAYFAKCMVYEKRQACQINNENFRITARMTACELANHTTLAEREKFLNNVETEAIMHISPYNTLRAKLAGSLPPSVAYNLLSRLIYFNTYDNILKMQLTSEIVLSERNQDTILQEANAVGGSYAGVNELEIIINGVK